MRLSVLFLLLVSLQVVLSAKILVLYAFSSKSQKNFASPIVYALAERGHEIVFVSAFNVSKSVPGVKEIYVNTSVELNFFEVKEKGQSFVSMFLDFSSRFANIFHTTFTSHEIQILRSKKFDLVMVNGFMNDFTYGWIHQMNVPVVGLFGGSPFPWHLQMLGNPISISHVGNFMSGSEKDMSFFSRAVNVGGLLLLLLMREFILVPKFDSMIKERFPDSPGVKAVENNISLMLLNSHFSIQSPRPYLPSFVEVGGVHCHPAKPLPKDLADFVEGSGEDGFIYFSFGSVVKGSDMPDKIRRIFLDTFSQLPQRVLWKWETETMEGLPKNVKLSKWLPQQDLLGHPKCRAFITHGGGLSTQEANFHGVPLIGFPFFGDQDINMRNAVNDGYAIQMDLFELRKEDLLTNLKKIMHDQKFRERVKELSTLFRDQPDSPLNRAVFWVEYVLRHKGAPHLRPAAADSNFFQNLLVDVLAFVAFVFFLFLLIVFFVTRFTIKLLLKLCKGKKEVARGKKNR